jgi:putative peptide zinc metalloprotease protein
MADGGLVYDPAAHGFTRLDAASFVLLAEWRQAGALGAAAKHAETSVLGSATEAHLKDLETFARRNGWLLPETDAEVRAIAASAAKAERRDWRWLMHSYISFRLPLIAPEPWLDRMAPVLNLLFSRAAFVVTGVLGVAAVYLATRQWAELTVAAKGLLSPSALALMGVALLVVKVWHEIGHGHMARRYGCRVPSAGVMMILGAPLFYTDVTDAWRLSDRRHRMAVAGAGVVIESMLAVAALLAWVFLPDGALRSLCFYVATGSIITSLAVNLSPFMRFDGYFLLSDGLRIPNLHAKAFTAMTWLLRRWLLGFSDPRPREIVGLHAGWLALFGVATALYRLGLFLGLALLVYHMTFKVLGFLLFVVEILWFVVRPVWRELMVWRSRRKDIRWRQGLAGVVVAFVLAVLLLAPLSTHVRMKAVIEAGQLARLHAPVSAMVSEVHVAPGAFIRAGQPVITLSSAQLSHQLAQTETRLSLLTARLARSGGDAQERALIQVLISEKASMETQRAGVAAQIDALVLRAPLDGRVMEIDREVQPGSSVSPKLRLALLSSHQGLSARAYAGAEARSRLQLSAQAWFVPEDPSAARVLLKLAAIGAAAAQIVEPAALAEPLGGDVPAVADRSGKPSATAAAFLLSFVGDGAPPVLAQRGSIHVAAASESLAARALRRAASVLIRESGV